MKFRLLFLALALAMLLVGTAAASTINVNTTGWWEEGNAFNASPTPIQSALNNATSGDTIRVVETASYSESISVTQNNLRLNLQGSTLDGSASSSNGVTISSKNEFTIGNGTIVGFRSAILTAGTVSDFTIDNIVITNPSEDGIQLYGHVTDFTISDSLITDPRYGIYSDNDFNTDGFNAINVTILNPGSRGIFLDDHNNNNIFTKDVYLEDVTVSNSAGAGIYIVNNDESSGNTTIVDSHISNCARAFQLDSGKGPILISNSTFIDGTDYGLYMSATSGSELTLTNNIISGNNNGLYLNGFSDFTFPTSNTVSNNGGYVFNLANLENVTIRDFVIDNSHYRGFSLTTCTNFTLGNISISGSTDNSILVSGSNFNITFEDLTITDPAVDGIQFYGHVTDFTISDSLITDPRYGIYSDNDFNTDGFNAINVTILNPGSRGIFLDDHNNNNIFTKDVYLEDVTVSNSAGAGIYIVNNDESSGNTTIVDSHISNCARAFQLDSGKGPILISNSTFIDGTDYGLYMSATSGSELTLTNNIISGNNNGLYLSGFSDFTFPTSNTFNNTGTAFSLTSTDNVTLQDIVINYPHTTGVYLNANTNLTLSNVSILYSAGNAISFGGTSSNITFEDLTITDPASCGIYIPGNVADFEIYDSVITDPTYGIQSYYQNTLNGFDAVNVTILNPSSRGISLRDSSSWGSFIKDIYLENVTVDGSSGEGIYITNSHPSSSNTTIVNSNVNGSSSHGISLTSMKSVILLDSNNVTSNGDSASEYGIYVTNSGITNLTVVDNVITRNSYGAYLQAALYSDVTLLDNQVSDNDNGIHLLGFSNHTLSPTNQIFNNTGTAFSLTSTDNVTLQDIVINYPHTTGVYLNANTNLTLSNVSILYSAGNAISFGGTSSNITFEDLTITDPASCGIYIPGNVADFEIYDSVITDPTYGIQSYYQNTLNGFDAVNVTILNPSSRGISLRDSSSWGSFIKDIYLENVTVDGSSGEGIYITNSHPSSSNTTIVNSNVNGSSSHGISLTSMKSVILLDSNNVTSNGDSASEYGIYVTNSGITNLTVVDNVITRNSYGAYLQAALYSDVTLLDNQVSDNDNGIHLLGFSNHTLSPTNQIFNNTGTAFSLTSTDNVTLQDIVINYPHTTGVYLNANTNLTLSNVSILYSAGNAISFGGTSSNITFEDLTITDPASCGIYIPGNVADFEIYDSVITDPTYGIQSYYRNTLNGFDAVNVTILNPSSRGISLEESSSWGSFIKDAYLENVTVDCSSGDGIYIQNSYSASSNTTIVNSNVNGSSGYGIYLGYMRGTIVLENNTVSSSGSYGLDLHNSSITEVTLFNNTFDSNANGFRATRVTSNLNESVFNSSGGVDITLSSSDIDAYNTSFNTSRTSIDSNSELNVYWYMDVTVVDGFSSPVSSASVSIYNSTDSLVYSGSTSGSGAIPTQLFREFMDNSSRYYDSPYRILATKAATGSNESTFDLNASAGFTLMLLPEPPIITSWGNNQTSDNNLNLTIEKNSVVRFNATSDLVANWIWTNATYISGNTTVSSEAESAFNDVGNMLVYVVASNSNGSSNILQWNCTVVDTTGPASVSGLDEDSVGYTWINWTWTNPIDADFNHSMVYLNGSFVQNSSDAFFNATGLNDNSSYEIGIRTVDLSGNVNSTWINDTASTPLIPDITAPASVSVLGEDSIGYTWINWTWTNPSDSDFNYSMIYLNGSFVQNSSDAYFNATSLNDNSSYEVGIRTVDTSGNINSTWVNDTASTLLMPDTNAPASVTGLGEDSVGYEWINWTWTNPVDADFNYCMIYLNGSFVLNSSDTYFNATGLDEDSSYELAIRTVDTSYNVNSTWVNDTASTADDSTAPASVSDLNETAVSHNWINWTWTNPADSDFNYSTIYLNGIFLENASLEYCYVSNLDSNCTYEVGIRTVDIYGNVNTTWMNDTATTDVNPPVSEKKSSGGTGSATIRTNVDNVNDTVTNSSVVVDADKGEKSGSIGDSTSGNKTYASVLGAEETDDLGNGTKPEQQSPGFGSLFMVAGISIAFIILNRCRKA